MTERDTEQGELAVVYPALLRRLRQDQTGREIIDLLSSDPSAGNDELSRWLDAQGAPTLATSVTGGVVDKIVNVAHADVVQLLPERPIERPMQLAAAIPDFVDREPQLSQIADEVGRAAAASGPLVIMLSGAGGIGKSALAARAAHALLDRYPDAQLYANLRGAGATPLAAGEVLDGFLRALGYDGLRIPAGVEDKARVFRTALTGRRSIVLLDNAASEAQIRPLLPGSPDVLVLVTSRERLTAIEGAVSVALDLLEPFAAVDLLARIVGADRVRAEEDATREVLTLCGYLPLAIRVAAAKLASRPHWRIERLAGRLRDERRRLGELSTGDLDVRGTFMLSYRDLSPDHQRAFRFAGALPGPDFAGWSLAALLDCDLERAEDLAEDLVAAQLFEASGEDGTGEMRYRFHDLLRVFAREELANTETPSEREAAVERALGAALSLAKRGLYLLSPHSRRDDVVTEARLYPVPPELAQRILRDPYDWFEAEYASLVAGIRQAHEERLWECAWELAETMHYFFRVRALRADWRETHELALDAARRARNSRGEAWTLRNLGNAYRDQYDVPRAAECFELALEIFRGLNNRLGEAAALNNLGELAMDTGRLDDSATFLTECIELWAEVDDQVGVTYVTNHLGVICRQQGKWSESNEYLTRAGTMFRAIGDRWGEAHGLRSLADLRREQGELAEAVDLVLAGRAIFLEMGDRVGAAWASICLAHIRVDQGEPAEALRLISAAIEVFREYSDHRGETWSLSLYGEASGAMDGNQVVAAAALEEGLVGFENLPDALGEAIARYRLGEVYLAQNDRDRGRESLRTAVEIFGRIGAEGWRQKGERVLNDLD